MSDYDFILSVKEMKSISEICDRLKIDYSNLITGRSTKENEKKVADLLRVEVLKIYGILNSFDSSRIKYE